MASKNMSYIQKSLDKLFSAFKISKAEMSDIENLRAQALTLIIGNEEEYTSYIDKKIDEIKEKMQLIEDEETAKLAIAAQKNYNIEPDEVDVQAIERVNNYKNNMKLQKIHIKGKINGKALAVGIGGIAITSALFGCGLVEGNDKANSESSQPQVIVDETETTPIETEIETEISDAEIHMQEYVKATIENVINASNGMLSNGVACIDKDLNEDLQKEKLAEIGLQYYVVANIDDMTPAEYINFMQAEHGNVVDKDDLIYNFRILNEMFKDQIMVSSPDNKIDFATIFKDEMDAKLLNDGADYIARLNVAKNKKEKQAISKEFYDYTVNIFNDDLSNFKYSNSALATFINSEFSAWCELAKSAGFKKGVYPDDELEARIMTVINNCGKSSGEKTEVEVIDETKTSLESINVTRIINTLNSRFEAATINYKDIELYDFASYGQMKQKVIEGIDLTKYLELKSYTEKERKKIQNTKPVINKNDSGISNGQGGSIAKSEFTKYNIDSSSPTAKSDYEAAVRKETEEMLKKETTVKNEDGEVVNKDELINWTQQGAIDANNGTINSNVPAQYKDAYQKGHDTANIEKLKVEQELSSSTKYETVPEQIIEQTESVEQSNFIGSSTSTTESRPQTEPEIIVSDTPTEVINPNYNETTFVPLGSEEQIISETTSETYEGFVENANNSRTIEVKTLSRDKKLQELYDYKKQLSAAALNAIENANLILSEIEENNKTK